MAAMKRKKATKAEREYAHDMQRRSALRMAEEGSAKVLSPSEYPAPLQRFLIRERNTLHIKLTAATRRLLEAQSRRTGLPVDEIARRWIETGLRRHTG